MGIQKVVFLKGQKVILRPLDKETDLESCLRWINDSETLQYLKGWLPTTKADEGRWFEEATKKADNRVEFAIDTCGGKFIGVINLRNINWKDRVTGVGALIGDKNYWRKGYGTDAMMLLLNFAFNCANLRKVYASIWSFNPRSLGMARKCGFVQEGRKKAQVFVGGRYHDEVIVGVFKKDWLPIWRKYQRTYSVR